MSSTEGGRTTDPSEQDLRRYLQGELDNVKPSVFTDKIKVKFAGEGASKWLNLTAAQYEAIKKILVPEPQSLVSFTPCITGKVEVDGAVSEFMLPLANDSVGFSQWGAPDEVLWGRVELLDNLSGQAREWWADNQPEDEDDDGPATDGDLVGPLVAVDDDVVDELIADGLVEEVENPQAYLRPTWLDGKGF